MLWGRKPEPFSRLVAREDAPPPDQLQRLLSGY
jgi:hypothetical protein